jgi:hypothetical protein
VKKLIICLAILLLPLFAEEIWLGLVTDVQGDYLVLVDGLKVHAPHITFANSHNQAVDARAIVFPFSASLITHDETATSRTTGALIKIHAFYEEVDGRLVEQTSSK